MLSLLSNLHQATIGLSRYSNITFDILNVADNVSSFPEFLLTACPFLFALQTMNKVFEHAGDLVNIKVAHNLMRLIAEGFGEDDDTADSQLRSSAVCYHYDFIYLHLK